MPPAAAIKSRTTTPPMTARVRRLLLATPSPPVPRSPRTVPSWPPMIPATFRDQRSSPLLFEAVRHRRHRGSLAEEQPCLEDQRALIVQQMLPPVFDKQFRDQHGDDPALPSALE